jgi:hypothetical protein
MKADASSISRAPNDSGDRRHVELFPSDEQQELALLLAQPGQRCGDASGLAGCGRAGRRQRLGLESREQVGARAQGAPVVGEHAPGGRIEPVERLLAVRDVRESPPGDSEGLGDDIERVLRTAAPLRVAQDPGTTPFPVGMSVTGVISGSRSASR